MKAVRSETWGQDAPIHVVAARLSECPDSAAELAVRLAPNLDPAQAERWALFAHVDDRRRFLLARECALAALARLMGSNLAAAAVLGSGPGGQPRLIAPVLPEPPFLTISWSHAGDLCVASAAQHPHGIDTEPFARGARVLHMAPRLLAEGEDGPNTAPEALAFWTAKEAVQKALGLGMRLDMRRVRLMGSRADVSLSRDRAGFTLTRLPIAYDHVTSLAISEEVRPDLRLEWLHGHGEVLAGAEPDLTTPIRPETCPERPAAMV